MSHGCVNMAIPDAEKIFYWVGPVYLRGPAWLNLPKRIPVPE